jgi:nitrogen regulatory protein P-II 1
MLDNVPINNRDSKLIITIVNKGAASNVVAVTKKAGVGGGTILFGRGSKPPKNILQLLGLDYDPEKEIILSIVDADMADSVLDIIQKTASLDKPGKGIAFMLDITNVMGIIHLLNR